MFPPRNGNAFIRPVIALVEGALFAGEGISGVEALATGLLLVATWLGLKTDPPVRRFSQKY